MKTLLEPDPQKSELPAQFEDDVAIEFCRLSVLHGNTIVFPPGLWVRPFGLLHLLLACKLQGVSLRNSKTPYLNVMRFPDAAFTAADKLDAKLSPDGAWAAGTTYLKISTLQKQNLGDPSKGLEFDDHPINVEADKLARFLLRKSNSATNIDGDTNDALVLVRYCFKELIRNFVDHACAERLWICGQYYPSSGEVRITLADQGRGLRESLRDNANVADSVNSDDDAIRLSLQAGVSSKLGPDSVNVTNSGFGLYFVKKITDVGGALVLCTGERAMVPWGAGGFVTCSKTGTHIGITVNLMKFAETFAAKGLKELLIRWELESGVGASAASKTISPVKRS